MKQVVKIRIVRFDRVVKGDPDFTIHYVEVQGECGERKTLWREAFGTIHEADVFARGVEAGSAALNHFGVQEGQRDESPPSAKCGRCGCRRDQHHDDWPHGCTANEEGEKFDGCDAFVAVA